MIACMQGIESFPLSVTVMSSQPRGWDAFKSWISSSDCSSGSNSPITKVLETKTSWPPSYNSLTRLAIQDTERADNIYLSVYRSSTTASSPFGSAQYVTVSVGTLTMTTFGKTKLRDGSSFPVVYATRPAIQLRFLGTTIKTNCRYESPPTSVNCWNFDEMFLASSSYRKLADHSGSTGTTYGQESLVMTVTLVDTYDSNKLLGMKAFYVGEMCTRDQIYNSKCDVAIDLVDPVQNSIVGRLTLHNEAWASLPDDLAASYSTSGCSL
jgi:hypothetical protein